MGVVFDGKGINSHTDGIVRLFRLPVRSSMIHDIHSDGRPTGSRCLSEPNLRGATPGGIAPRGVLHYTTSGNVVPQLPEPPSSGGGRGLMRETGCCGPEVLGSIVDVRALPRRLSLEEVDRSQGGPLTTQNSTAA